MALHYTWNLQILFFRNHFLKSSVNNYHTPTEKPKIKQQTQHTQTHKKTQQLKIIPPIFESHPLKPLRCPFKPNNQPTKNPSIGLLGHHRLLQFGIQRHGAQVPNRLSDVTAFRGTSESKGEGIGRWMDQWMGCFLGFSEQKTQIWLGVRYGWKFLDDRIFLDGIFYVFVHKTMKILRDT